MILGELARRTGLDVSYLARLAGSASHRYKTYTIPKRKGGSRTIQHPSRQLKFIQRWLVDNVFAFLPIHNAVYSYRHGRGIKDLATLHASNNYLLRVDFQGFFPSIVSSDLTRLLSINKHRFPIELSVEDYVLISCFVCKDNQLTIGSPSSPILSNTVMYDFDTYWFERSRQIGVTYARYADDLYFSTNIPNVLEELLQELHLDLQNRESPRLKINETKTIFTSRKRRRLVTGLVLTSTNDISIGRARKRYLKSLVYKFVEQGLETDKLVYLRGYLSYVQAVEPLFLRSLMQKYGINILDRLNATGVTIKGTKKG